MIRDTQFDARQAEPSSGRRLGIADYTGGSICRPATFGAADAGTRDGSTARAAVKSLLQ
jgi:hypothetical protein